MYMQRVCVCVCKCSGQQRNESGSQRVKQQMSGIKYAIGKLNVMAAFGRICRGRHQPPFPSPHTIHVSCSRAYCMTVCECVCVYVANYRR